MRYRLVCLDAGFTLLVPRRTLAEALRGVLATLGREVTDDELHQAWQVADRWFWEDYRKSGSDTWGNDERIDATWRHYHTLMLGELGIREPKAELIDATLAAQYAPDSWELYPDVLPVVRALRTAGARLGVVSDWGSNLVDIIEALGLASELDFVLASGAVGLSKPDPAYFRLAASRVGVAPEEAVMVGDTVRADIEGARSTGMGAVLIRRPEWQDREEVVPKGVPVIASLEELPEIVLGD